MTDVVITTAGETLRLMPERALLWEARSTLIVADTHWGKAATFRSAGLPVPHGTTAGGLARLDRALARSGARRLLFLGDFLHAREGRTPRVLDALAAWRRSWTGLPMTLVPGNHDRSAGNPPPELEIECVAREVVEGPFAFRHHPGTEPGRYVLAGHLHPSIRLVGTGRQRARLPCFWFGEKGAVLPAFGEFTGSANVEPAIGDRVFAVVEEAVIEVRAAPGPRRGRRAR